MFWLCSRCGKLIASGTAVCAGCGATLGDSPPTSEPSKPVSDGRGTLRAGKYASYVRRIGALAIDLLLLYFVFTVFRELGKHSPSLDSYVVEHRVIAFMYFLMNVFMVGSFGGSPGTLILGMRVVRPDFSAVRYREAVLRVSPTFGLWGVALIARIVVEMGEEWLRAVALGWFAIAPFVSVAWYATDAGVWFWNHARKRQALHDLIADTVVIRSLH